MGTLRTGTLLRDPTMRAGLRAAINAERRRRVGTDDEALRSRTFGLAFACFEMTAGDPLLALAYALDHAYPDADQHARTAKRTT